MATTAEEYAASLNLKLGNLPRGSLRFWGVWFGRPYDNNHSIVGAEGQSDLLRIKFDDGELLSVWSPSGLKVSATVFQIADAARVRWEWNSYGSPAGYEEKCFEDFQKGQNGISNSRPSAYLKPVPESMAVEILSLEWPPTAFSRLKGVLRFFRAKLVQ
jgi:hypothetical protein